MKAKLKNNHLVLIAVFFCALAVLMAWPTGVQAEAAEDFTVIGGQVDQDYTYENNTLTITSNTPMSISGATQKDKIVVAASVTDGELTFNDLSIDLSNVKDVCPFSLSDGSAVRITLANVNTLMSNHIYGLRVPAGASLTIEGEGKLTARSNKGEYNGCHGIRVETESSKVGVLTINGGIIEAYASGAAFGIGGEGGTVNINGGIVTAQGSYNGGSGAGIGGGKGIVNITGGIVNAIAGYRSAGIGSSDETVRITGGTVLADSTTGKGNGTGINGSSVTITGGNVKVKSNSTYVNNPTDGQGNALSLVTLEAVGSSANQSVELLKAGTYTGADTPDPTTSVYGIHDMQTDSEGSLYLYLPGNAISDTNKAAELWFGGAET